MDESHGSWAGRDERVFVHLPIERRLLEELRAGARVLDLGCGDGSHMQLLSSTGGHVIGMDVSLAHIDRARQLAPVVAAAGERLPFADGSFDFVYLSHVLHHALDVRAVLDEIGRVLVPGGAVMVVETCEDSPLMRLARTLRPSWESVPVRSRFRYSELLANVHEGGFRIETAGQYNVLYWTWGFARRFFRPLERLMGLVVRVELIVVRWLRRYSAYGYVVARKSGKG